MNKELLALFLVVLMVMKKYEAIQIGYEHILILVIFSIILSLDSNYEFEHLTSNEAVQSIASIYNNSAMTVSDLNVTGKLTVTGDIVGQNNLSVAKTSTLGKWSVRDNRIGISGLGDLHLADDKWVRLYDYNTTNYNPSGLAGSNLWSGGGLTVGGVGLSGTNLGSLILRKTNVAGYFGIRGYASKTPIYYGWNMMWKDHNRLLNLVSRSGKPMRYTYSADYDMRQSSDGDENWRPRTLVLFPGYIAKFFYWSIASSASRDVINTGEYEWGDGTFPGRVHAIYVSLVEEGAYAETRTGQQLMD